jgi:hypothetical protein
LQVAPPGVGVDDGSPAEELWVSVAGLIKRNPNLTPALVREGLNEELQEKAIANIPDKSYQYV